MGSGSSLPCPLPLLFCWQWRVPACRIAQSLPSVSAPWVCRQRWPSSSGQTMPCGPLPGDAFTQPLWSSMTVGGFSPSISLYLDALSVVMILVVTVVGFFILLYSSEHMGREEGYSRFFAYMNLFIGSMLTLVLADNLLALYLGWEGVGLCSYLLIGFWYRDAANIHAANKAFIITRVGDTALAIGLILLFLQLDTLSIQEILARAQAQWPRGSETATWAALLLLGGAVGKSAQLPLQTWLPDAMAGPSPVSALIHAATMVTAGVYLIARTHGIFTLAPDVSCSSLSSAPSPCFSPQRAPSFMGHQAGPGLVHDQPDRLHVRGTRRGRLVGRHLSCLYPCLFQGPALPWGRVVIAALADEHDLHRMGGFAPRASCHVLDLSCRSRVARGPARGNGGLLQQGSHPEPGVGLFSRRPAALGGRSWRRLSHGAYTFPMVFLAFFGESKTPVIRKPGVAITVSLVVFAFFSLASGFLQMPALIAPVSVF